MSVSSVKLRTNKRKLLSDHKKIERDDANENICLGEMTCKIEPIKMLRN